MTKKILTSVAAAALISTSAMAFDNIDSTTSALPYTFAATSTTATSNIARVGQGAAGDALIFPAFNVGNGWQTTVRVMNTSSTNAVVAKVVLYAGDDSRELRDFNIYLSANDVWEGTIKIDDDGVARLISTDGSAPLTDGTMASVDKPMKSDAIAAAGGYIEVIGCAMAVDATNKANATTVAADAGTTLNVATAHNDHAALRASYKAAAANARITATPVVFNNGVITSGAKVPAVKATTALKPGFTSGSEYVFADVTDVLVGDVRITDTVNGKDMDLPAVKLTGVTEDGTAGTAAVTALMFMEGEAANIADRDLQGADDKAGNQATNQTAANVAAAVNNAGKSEYDYSQLSADASAFTMTNVLMNYGDSSSAVNNQLLLTSPFKRLLIMSDASIAANGTTVTSNGNTNVIGTLYNGVAATNSQITNWGAFSALALIYDQDETQASASQFSPANTPTMNFKYELSASEGNSIATDNLSTYLAQAGFDKGFVDIKFRHAGGVPTIATQMMATDVAGKVVTNWITPEWN